MEFAEIETHNRGETTGVKSSGGGDGGGGKGSQWGNGASPGKIFIGGLSRETTTAQFLEHFGAYGEITDNVIIKDRNTGLPRGFGFITYADPAVVDQVIEDSHIINGKQVEIKRTIPKGFGGGEEFKTKKIFVGGIPATVTEDELRDFFSKFGEITEHQIMKDPVTGRARGFGFVMFDNEKPVDDILSRGNKLDMGGVQVSSLLQGKRDVETVLTMGILEDVSIIPQPAEDKDLLENLFDKPTICNIESKSDFKKKDVCIDVKLGYISDDQKRITMLNPTHPKSLSITEKVETTTATNEASSSDNESNDWNTETPPPIIESVDKDFLFGREYDEFLLHRIVDPFCTLKNWKKMQNQDFQVVISKKNKKKLKVLEKENSLLQREERRKRTVRKPSRLVD